MKGPHFFEKRKKEMARQEKLKQKAERKAQRKAEKGKEGGEGADDEDLLIGEDGEAVMGGEGTGHEAAGIDGDEARAQEPSETEH